MSPVSVFIPNLISAIYVFSNAVNLETNLVYFPMQTTKTPEAIGSKVPV